jgi:hypothetical protein
LLGTHHLISRTFFFFNWWLLHAIEDTIWLIGETNLILRLLHMKCWEWNWKR